MENLATQLSGLFSTAQRADKKQSKSLVGAKVLPRQQNDYRADSGKAATLRAGDSRTTYFLCGTAYNRVPSRQLFLSQVVSTRIPPAAAQPVAASCIAPCSSVDLDGSADPEASEAFGLMLPAMSLEMPGAHEPLTNPPSKTLIPAPSPVSSDSGFGLDTLLALIFRGQEHSVQQKHSGQAEAIESEARENTVDKDDISMSALPPSASPADHTTDQTALKEAICRNDVDTVKALIAEGVSVQLENWSETPLLVFAARMGNPDITQALIKAGANVNRGYDRLPLHVAAEYGHFDVVHMLLCAGAYLEASEESGYTALMCAAAAGQLLLVQALVDCGANVHANYYGKTPLMLAARYGHDEVYQFLYAYTRSPGTLMTDQMLPQRAVMDRKRSQLELEMASMLKPDRKITDIPR
ncbi:MAG: ankyrin repeat domain-containing protein [Cyanobacteria bacterium J06649_5]